MKKFNYKNYKNCYFVVASYAANDKAMAISIENEKGPISVCTVYDGWSMYSEHITTIKNYSENSHMTEFLQKMGIVIDILNRTPCNEFERNTINSSNPQTIDSCLIDTDKLREYAKEWHYNV